MASCLGGVSPLASHGSPARCGDDTQLDMLFGSAAQVNENVLRLGETVEAVEERQLRLDRRLAELDAQVQGVREEQEAALRTPRANGSDDGRLSSRLDSLDVRVSAMERSPPQVRSPHTLPATIFARSSSQDRSPQDQPDSLREALRAELCERLEAESARWESRFTAIEQGQRTVALGVKRALSTAIAARGQKQPETGAASRQEHILQELLQELRPELPQLLRTALPDADILQLMRDGNILAELQQELRADLMNALRQELQQVKDNQSLRQMLDASLAQVELLGQQMQKHTEKIQRPMQQVAMPDTEFWEELQSEAQSHLRAVQTHLENEAQAHLLTMQQSTREQLKALQVEIKNIAAEASAKMACSESTAPRAADEPVSQASGITHEEIEALLEVNRSQALASVNDVRRHLESLQETVDDRVLVQLWEGKQSAQQLAGRVDRLAKDFQQVSSDVEAQVVRLNLARERLETHEERLQATAVRMDEHHDTLVGMRSAPAAPSAPLTPRCGSTTPPELGKSPFVDPACRDKPGSSSRVVGSLAEFASSLWSSRHQRMPDEQAQEAKINAGAEDLVGSKYSGKDVNLRHLEREAQQASSSSADSKAAAGTTSALHAGSCDGETIWQVQVEAGTDRWVDLSDACQTELRQARKNRDDTISFHQRGHRYVIDLKAMIQKNVTYAAAELMVREIPGASQGSQTKDCRDEYDPLAKQHMDPGPAALNSPRTPPQSLGPDRAAAAADDARGGDSQSREESPLRACVEDWH